eukprot:COSAG02_NODE_422_length_22587_cov_10.209089_12_plen_100_part_00
MEAEWLQRSFAVHTTGPLLLIQALAPQLRVKKNERSPAAVVNISARVGSIEDNNLGGWCDTGLRFRARRAHHFATDRGYATVGLMLSLWMVVRPGTHIA